MTKRVALEGVLEQFLKTQDLDQAIEDIETIFNYNIGEIKNIKDKGEVKK